MTDIERSAAGFESYWDAAWFSAKADEFRALAKFSRDPGVVQCLADLAQEFAMESERAERLAKEESA